MEQGSVFVRTSPQATSLGISVRVFSSGVPCAELLSARPKKVIAIKEATTRRFVLINSEYPLAALSARAKRPRRLLGPEG